MLGKPCNGLGSNFEGNKNTKQLNATKPEPVLAKLDIPPTQTLFYYFTILLTALLLCLIQFLLLGYQLRHCFGYSPHTPHHASLEVFSVPSTHFSYRDGILQINQKCRVIKVTEID